MGCEKMLQIKLGVFFHGILRGYTYFTWEVNISPGIAMRIFNFSKKNDSVKM